MGQEPDFPETPLAGLSRRWWLISLGVAIAMMIGTSLLLWLPQWPGTLIFFVALLAFGLTSRWHPAFWYRRMAGASFGASVVSGVVPSIDVTVIKADGSFGSFVTENAAWLIPSFVTMTIVFAVLDYLTHHQRRGSVLSPVNISGCGCTPHIIINVNLSLIVLATLTVVILRPLGPFNIAGDPNITAKIEDAGEWIVRIGTLPGATVLVVVFLAANLLSRSSREQSTQVKKSKIGTLSTAGDAAGQSVIKTGDHSPVTVQAGVSEHAALDTITSQAKEIQRLQTQLETALADKPSVGEDPTVANLSEDQRLLVEKALESGDAETKAKAAVLARDFEAADKYLSAAMTPVLEKAFELFTLEGDRYYYAGEFDRSIDPYESAHRLAPDSGVARHNLALAFAQTQVADAGENLERAIDLYRKLLKEHTRERVPLDWAMMQNNLGTTLMRLGERESGTERLEEAVVAFRDAREERTRERVPLDWATTQNNLGAALMRLGERESGTERLEEAVAAYCKALEERTRERVPLNWAATQNNLGNALLRLGERESGTERMEEAVAAYREALVERTRECVPLDWAMTQNNLGNALSSLGERESGTGRLGEAVAAYRESLEEHTRERVPLDWAMTQNNLGTALMSLGERESGTERWEEALAAYREALEERTRERVPLDWARTQSNLGAALSSLGDRESGTWRLEEAVAAFKKAMEVFQDSSTTLYFDHTNRQLEAAQNLLKERSTDQ
ncbi:MAG: tetratricopeptide repeat protein [Planctomycetota bacterium]|nr:tetratricopeptide repeat protein [Planctomycetota bacterium]